MRERVLVLLGGLSKEREISIRSGTAIATSLKRNGFEVLEYDFQGHLEQVIAEFKPDVVFIALHGTLGEDGTVQGMLEIAQIPYTGCGVLQSAVCMNKLFTKYFFREIDVPTPKFVYKRKGESVSFSEIKKILNCDKVVVKPVDQGSAIGVSIVNDEDGFKEALNESYVLSNGVLVEEFIKGTEITITVIGNYPDIKVFPIIEIVPVHDFYDFYSKYTPGMSKHNIPANISQKAAKSAEEYAFKIYQEMGLRDIARIDMIAMGDEVLVLEVNTIPGFTETSLVPDAAASANISFDDLTDFIVKEALKRKK